MTDDLVARLRDLGIRSADLAADHIEALTAERDALIRDRNRWAEEAQVNTSPVIAGLIAERDRLRVALAVDPWHLGRREWKRHVIAAKRQQP